MARKFAPYEPGLAGLSPDEQRKADADRLFQRAINGDKVSAAQLRLLSKVGTMADIEIMVKAGQNPGCVIPAGCGWASATAQAYGQSLVAQLPADAPPPPPPTPIVTPPSSQGSQMTIAPGVPAVETSTGALVAGSTATGTNADAPEPLETDASAPRNPADALPAAGYTMLALVGLGLFMLLRKRR